MGNTKVVVKEAAQKQPEETAYSIVSAEVTGAKTITVTLNKAVADATKVTAAVKKGSAAKDSKFAAEGEKVVITTDTKLMAGTYTVTIGGLEETDLTATVEVAKDETLTSYEIGAELIADADVSTTGYIYYKALNQYGEMMNADAPSATCTFSSAKAEVMTTATADREGCFKVTDINTSLAIIGTKGNVILVDQNAGVNKTGEVVYSSPATAAEVTVDGLYNTAKSTFQDITAKDSIRDYYLLLTVKDQYNHQLSYDKLKKDVSITIAGGITHVESDTTINASDTAKGLKDFSIGGKDYIAAVLKGAQYQNTSAEYAATAGSATVTMVNNKRGLILTHTIDVAEYVVVANFVISAENGIYNHQENEISFEATDKDGKTITDFATLRKTVGISSNNGEWNFQKKADGTAKLVFEPSVSITANASHTASALTTAVISLNETTSPDFKIKTQNLTVKQDREPVSVQGLAADTATQFSATAGKLSIDLDKIVFADQYANKVTKDENIYPATGNVLTDGTKSAGKYGVKIVASPGMTTAKVSGPAFAFASKTESSYATVYLKYYNKVKDIAEQKVVSETDYDYKFVVTCVDTQQVAASSVKITNVFGGNVEFVDVKNKSYSSKIKESDIEVKATVAGSATVLDPSQYVIKSVDNGSFTTDDENKGVKTKTATVTIQVTTFDSDNNPTVTELKSDYTISYDDAKATSIKEVSATGKAAMTASSGAITVTTSGKLTAEDMQTLFTFKDQYGQKMTLTKVDTNVKYSILSKETTAVRVYGEDNNNVYATAHGKYLLTITATATNGKSVTKDFWVQF